MRNLIAATVMLASTQVFAQTYSYEEISRLNQIDNMIQRRTDEMRQQIEHDARMRGYQQQQAAEDAARNARWRSEYLSIPDYRY